MGLWELITGKTIEGLPTDNMSADVILAYSVKGYLSQLLNTRKGSCFLRQDMGVSDIPDIVTRIPSNIDDIQKALESMILTYDQRIKQAFFQNWNIEKSRRCLMCELTVILFNKQMLQFTLVLGGIGNNQVKSLTRHQQE